MTGKSPANLILLILTSGFLATRAPAAPPESPVDKLIAELGADEAEVRRKAAVRLLNLGGVASPAVEAALKREDVGPEAQAALRRAAPVLAARARAEARISEEIAYATRTCVGAYDRVGRRDPRWDDDAREGMRHWIARSVWKSRTSFYRDAPALLALRRALAAGCDDPLVRYFAARIGGEQYGADVEAEKRNLVAAARDLMESGYPPERKIFAWVKAVTLGGDEDPEMVERCLKLLPEALAQKDLPARVAFDVARDLLAAVTQLRGREAALEAVYPVYAASRPDSAYPLLLRGKFYAQFAWDARGSGYAHTVTPLGWKLFGERLVEADAALNKAWEIDPTLGQVAVEMMRVKLGQGDHPGHEAWFKRAVETEPDNYAAYAARLWYLYPRWHGSHEAMIDFGHQCLRTENWRAMIPLILVDAHAQIARETRQKAEYFKRPEVWREVAGVYKAYLELYPQNNTTRSHLALLACQTEHWDEALRQFEVLGDNPDEATFRGKARYEYYRHKAEQAAKSRKPQDPPSEPAGPQEPREPAREP